MLNKQEITELLQAPPSPKLAEEQASEETAEQTEQPLAETDSATASSAKVTRARTWHDLLQLMKDLEDFDMTTDHAMLMAGCLKRQLLMMPRIRALAAATHSTVESCPGQRWQAMTAKKAVAPSTSWSMSWPWRGLPPCPTASA